MRLWAFFYVSVVMLVVSVTGVPMARAKQSESHVELAMVVAGTVDIEEDGAISGYRLHRPEALPSGVRRVIDESIKTWRFEPVLHEGQPSKARAEMRLRLVANHISDDEFAVRLDNAAFSTSSEEYVTSKSLPKIEYPVDAWLKGIKGIVYVVAKVGRDGRPEQAIIEQVNITVIDHEANARRWRNELARVALAGARRWRFEPPKTGPYVDEPYWSVRVPVDFGTGEPVIGEWQAYMPGPRTDIPWDLRHGGDAPSDAYASGGVHPVGLGPRLATSLQGAAL